MPSPQQMQAVKELVERSRLGDQNATAMIIETRQSAIAGNAKAKEMLACMKAYAEENPATMHGETITVGTTKPKNKIAYTLGAGLLGLVIAPANLMYVGALVGGAVGYIVSK